MPSEIDIDKVQLNTSWKAELFEEFGREYFTHLVHFLKQEKRSKKTIYPPGNEIFAALNAVNFEDVRVVIIGQDPYHGPGQANGLCFSVRDGIAHPPSLINIFKELESDLGLPYPSSGDLSAWANQGVLLLNAVLTVEAHKAGSHQQKGWEKFTDAIIAKLSSRREKIVFLLWGGYAKNKGKIIDQNRHMVLTSGHPSPLSANRGYWFGNKHFSKTNEYLVSQGLKPIDWNV